MVRTKKRARLSREEQAIEKSLGEFVPVSPAEKKVVLHSAVKTRTISLRISDTVLESIKRKAAGEGLPYQTLISSVLYKFSSDRLIDEQAIRKALEALR